VKLGLDYQNLDDETRKLMLEELEITINDEKVYYSNYLSDTGKDDWLELLKEACTNGTDDTLAAELSKNGRLLAYTTKKKPKGGFTQAEVPYTANVTLAEGQFNRLYIRAICRRAPASGHSDVRIYRAAERAQERPTSVALVGTNTDAASLLERLRDALDFKSGFPEPNTGLSVTLI